MSGDLARWVTNKRRAFCLTQQLITHHSSLSDAISLVLGTAGAAAGLPQVHPLPGWQAPPDIS